MMVVAVSLHQHTIKHFLNGFKGMDDLVISINETGIRAAGTMDKAYFVSRWFSYRNDEECHTAGDIALGQLSTFAALVEECGNGGELVKISLDDKGVLRVVGNAQDFKMPTIQNATSQAGVSVIQKQIALSADTEYKTFGNENIPFDFSMSFMASDFSALQTTGKSIQNGALFCLSVESDNTLNLGVQRDSIRMNANLEPEPPHTVLNDTVMWFGKWLMDALRAMPKTGVIHLHGGNNTPLLIRHELDGIMSTTAIIAPRQEESGE